LGAFAIGTGRRGRVELPMQSGWEPLACWFFFAGGYLRGMVWIECYYYNIFGFNLIIIICDFNPLFEAIH